jgi:hypothetical protein
MAEINSLENESNEKKIYGEHPGLLPIEIQNNFDIWMQAEMEKCLSSEESLRSRIHNMSTMLRLFDAFRRSREKDEWKTPSEESLEIAGKLTEHIEFFNTEIWPQIQNMHQGIITDNKHPFSDISNISPDSILNHFSSCDKIADATDLTRELVENDQHSISYITRDMTKLTTKNEMVATMMSRRKHRETDRMIQNQITR